jgi:capsular polysaccharide transport system permease protein
MSDLDTPAQAPQPEGKPKRKARGRKAVQNHDQGTPYVPPPPASPAKLKTRHWGIVISFFIIVLLPISLSSWYFYTRAVDQYASTLGFTVRSEDTSSALDLLGGFGQALGGGGTHDSDVLFEFISSQELVRAINNDLDLRRKFSEHAEQDPLMSFDTEGTIEDLTDFWQRMVRVSYDSGSGLIELRVLAFRPEDAQEIARAIYDKSSTMINALAASARADATRYAQEDLDLAVERLKSAREALTAFRLANELVDPNADIQAQMGLMSTLQTQQAEAMIEFDLISETANSNNPRLEQAKRRLDVIGLRIDQERQKFGNGPGGEQFATTISEFERLSVDREYAETTYAAALTALDSSRAEANRQSRYLAAYIQPTLAEKSEFPQREIIIALVALFSFLLWATASLIYYAMRDRH